MLSRVADALFWMSRYIERAECVARLLDVGYHLELDLSGVAAGPSELHWASLLAILQAAAPAHGLHDISPQASIARWLTFDLENPSSILCCLNRARNNARSIRGSISPGMWRELNRLYFQLRDLDFCRQAQESPHDFYQAVIAGSHAFQGVCDAAMTRDEGWQFIQLGKYLERADKTLRIVDFKYHLLQDLSDPADLPLSNLQWAGVLRSCLAYEAYQRIYISRIDPTHVVEFLLLEQRFPRSVRFGLEHAALALAHIEGASIDRGESKADRTLGRVLSDLRYCDLDQVLPGALHGFLETILVRCNEVSLAVQGQYSLR